MKRKLVLFFPFLLILSGLAACDMTTSDKVEGVWVSRAVELSVLYEETYSFNKGGSYSYERKQDGKSVYKEEGSWVAEKQTVGNYEDEQRVITFTPATPKDTKAYVRLYALENGGKQLVLGTYDLDTDSVSKQRYYEQEVSK